jgi:hypothetical protein
MTHLNYSEVRPRPPTAIAVLDWLTVAAVVIAILVLLFGGFREHVAGVRISVRSWERLAIIAALLTAIRHRYLPRPTLPQLFAARIVRFWQSESRREIWPAFVATRLGVLLAGYLAVVTIGFAPGTERFRASDNAFANLVARWDAAWYLGIVTEGYNWNGNPKRQQNVVFFPAFPAATRVVGVFFGHNWLATGLLLALTAFFVALLYLYRLARDLLDADRARTGVWLLAAYPFAAYYSAPYTEAFYLLGSVSAFFYATRGQWWHAAAAGFFVGLCRPNGFLIALPLGVLVLQRMLQERRMLLAACAPIVAPLLGILTYSAFLYVRFGDALAWRKGQLAWSRTYVGVWPAVRALLEDRYNLIVHEGLYRYSVDSPYDLMYTAAAVFVLISVIPTMRRFGVAYGLFTLANILPPMLIGGMMSIGRMTSVLFPVFLWLGAIVPPRLTPALIALFCLLQGLVAILFFTWRPIF